MLLHIVQQPNDFAMRKIY